MSVGLTWVLCFLVMGVTVVSVVAICVLGDHLTKKGSW